MLSDTPMQRMSLVGWLTAVEDYWAKDGTLCGNCDFNDTDRGCDMLYAPSIPSGECVGIERKHGFKRPEEQVTQRNGTRAELAERVEWLADKLPAFGDYAKEAALHMRGYAIELRGTLSEKREQEGYPGIAHDLETMRTALQEIAKGAGPFSRDPLEHATNTIVAMKKLASDALGGVK